MRGKIKVKHFFAYWTDTYGGCSSVLTVLRSFGEIFMAYKLIFEERPESTETPKTPKRSTSPGELPAPYFLAEILYLDKLSQDERREIRKTKLAYGEVRLWQDGV